MISNKILPNFSAHSVPLCLIAKSYGVSPSSVNGRNGESCAIKVYILKLNDY